MFLDLFRRVASPRSAPAVTFLLLCASAPAFASVLVVAPAGAPFTRIQDAVDAASDGDIVLVRPGAYAGFTITNKALDVVAEPGRVVRVDGRVLVSHLEPTRTVTLSGLHVVAAPFQPALHLSMNQGAVRVQGCDLDAFDHGCAELRDGSAALDVDVCADVVVARCTLDAGDGSDLPVDFGYAGFGGDAVTPVQSRIAFYECSFTGGDGGGVDSAACGATQGTAEAGGAGGRFLGCPIVFGSLCTFVGGAGGIGGPPSSSAPSGNGLEVVGAAPYGDSHAWWLETTFHAGAPACAGCPSGMSTLVAPATTTSTLLAGAARRFHTRPLAREGDFVRMRFTGQPGDVVQLFIAAEARFEFSPVWRGVLCVKARKASAILQAGTIGASGVLDFGWTTSELGSGVDARRYFLQPMFVDASGQPTLGTPHTLVLLDSAF